MLFLTFTLSNCNVSTVGEIAISCFTAFSYGSHIFSTQNISQENRSIVQFSRNPQTPWVCFVDLSKNLLQV